MKTLSSLPPHTVTGQRCDRGEFGIRVTIYGATERRTCTSSRGQPRAPAMSFAS
jgi:hypothetical protein